MTDQLGLRFGGRTYDPEHDEERLNSQLERVRHVMWDGRWRTLKELQDQCLFRFGRHDSVTGLSARLRDLRKKEHGSHNVESRRRGDPKAGLWEYRLETR